MKPRSLFDSVKPKELNKNESIIKTDKDGWTSIYDPNNENERFVLISPKDEKFSCKFYHRDADDFIGPSLNAMYSLYVHYDRNIIPEGVK